MQARPAATANDTAALDCTAPQAAKEAARDPSMVGDGVARLLKSRYDSISTYLHYCKRREENPMHVLEVIPMHVLVYVA